VKKRLMRMLLLGAAGVIGRQIQKRFGRQGAPASHGLPAERTATPFEAQVRGDAVTYEADDPKPRDPNDPNEPFSGRALP
jgi:NAD(P)-dependent dehydrogenase (short-subunit alcohol dehydrogenase family)